MLKALIIDDEIDICYLLSSILKYKDVQPYYVNSLSEATLALQKETPAIIFLDNHLPDGMGMDYIQQIKKISPSAKIVMITAYDTSSDRIALKHIQVKKSYSTDICDIVLDAEKIKIAFLNIIVNAVEAMEDGKGILIIQTKAENGQCVIEITDNGIGMDAAALSKLFEPYFTTKPKGNGLGLTNTHNIILNHKGSINVISKPGEGSTFIIKFDFANLS